MVLYFLKSGLGVLNPLVLIRGFLLYVFGLLKKIWTYIKSMRRDNVGIGTLKKGKAEVNDN